MIMKSLEQKVLEFIEKQELIPPGSKVLVACSGGVDSMALLHFLAVHQEVLAIETGAVHVDHMLRGQESADDAKVVEQICKKYRLPFFSEQVPVPSLLEQSGGNVQMLCREERYKVFANIMNENRFTLLATGHHAEDQLETVLIQLSKGRSLNGMPIQRHIGEGSVIRPFLPAMKGELYEYAATHDLEYREDPSNQKDDYLRNRIRQQIVPVLLEENPAAAVSSVNRTVQRQAEEALLNELAEKHWKELVTYTDEQLPSFDRQAFLSIPHALQTRVIQLLLSCLPGPEMERPERRFATAVELLQHIQESAGNVMIDLAYGYRFVREYDKLLVTKKYIEPADFQPNILEKGMWHRWGNMQFYWQHAHSQPIGQLMPADEIYYFQLPDNELPLTARLREPGDRLRIQGMSQAKRVSRLLIDEKIGMTQRQQQPVITTAGGTVCAVPGVRYGKMFSRRQPEGESYIWITRKGENR